MADLLEPESTASRAAQPAGAAAGARSTSVSESLAYGLVTRLAREAAQTERILRARIGFPAPTAKRAAAFRAAVVWLRRTIPRQLVAGELLMGDQTGKDKAAVFGVLHWSAQSLGEASGLELNFSHVDARKLAVREQVLGSVSRHALMRIFFRLRSMEAENVLSELADLAQTASAWRRATRALPPRAELLVPSRRGAFVLVQDQLRPMTFAVRTYMTDQRMEDVPERRHAVAVARAEQGVVVNHAPFFPILSRRRLLRADGQAPEDGAVPPSALATPEGLNRLCDLQCGDRSRLPADWRFGTDEEVLAAWCETDAAREADDESGAPARPRGR